MVLAGWGSSLRSRIGWRVGCGRLRPSSVCSTVCFFGVQLRESSGWKGVVGVLRPDIVEKRRAGVSRSCLRSCFNRTSTKLQIVLVDGMAGYEIVELSC